MFEPTFLHRKAESMRLLNVSLEKTQTRVALASIVRHAAILCVTEVCSI